MLIDCNDCRMQATDACGDCVVTFLLNDVAGPIEFDEEQAEAIEVLADAGLVAPLRLVPRFEEHGFEKHGFGEDGLEERAV